MRPDCQLQAFNAEVTDSFTIALSPCSHSCPPTLVPSFGNDGEGCVGWCIALSFHDTNSPRTWRSSATSPNSFRPSLVILGRFPPRPGPLGLIFEMGRGTQILWLYNQIYPKYFNIHTGRGENVLKKLTKVSYPKGNTCSFSIFKEVNYSTLKIMWGLWNTQIYKGGKVSFHLDILTPN